MQPSLLLHVHAHVYLKDGCPPFLQLLLLLPFVILMLTTSKMVPAVAAVRIRNHRVLKAAHMLHDRTRILCSFHTAELLPLQRTAAKSPGFSCEQPSIGAKRRRRIMIMSALSYGLMRRSFSDGVSPLSSQTPQTSSTDTITSSAPQAKVKRSAPKKASSSTAVSRCRREDKEGRNERYPY